MINFLLHILIPVAHAAEEATHVATEATASGPVALFGLDFKLFIAQLFNFLIVLFVLWRWVFTPLTKKLSERTAKIENSLKNAENIEERIKETDAQRAATLSQARDQAASIITSAQKAAEQTKDQILTEAKKSGEKLIEQAKAEIDSQKEKSLAAIREEAANLVVTATERIIRQKLDAKADHQLIKDSLKQL